MDDADLALARALADAAGAAIRPFWRGEHGVEQKADASPVTIADRAAEAAMRAIIEAERPDDGIVGEEYGAVREGAGRLWVLDPIDGTRSFMAGRPIFGTLVALLEEGRPVLGVIDQPIGGERWIGTPAGTTLNGRAVRTRRCARLVDAHLATTGPNHFAPEERTRFDRLAAGDVLWGGDCYNYALVATGTLDGVIEAGLKLHDWAALVPIVSGAGGQMCDWQGASLHQGSGGRVVAVGDPALADEVLAALA